MSGVPSGQLEFVPLTQSGLRRWSRPARFDILDQLAVIPLGDTEILHLAHYAPIAVRLGEQGPEVVLVVHSRLTTSQLVDQDGKWRPPYAPMAIRSLPFRAAAQQSEPEVAPRLCNPLAEPFMLMTPEGKPAKEFAMVLEFLKRLDRSRLRLATAAKALLAADVLVPLLTLDDDPTLDLMVVQAERLMQLTGPRGAALTFDSNLPYELAAASIFSRRWLEKDAIPEMPEGQAPAAGTSELALRNQTMTEGVEELVPMDDSPLFSIDEFLKTARTDP